MVVGTDVTVVFVSFVLLSTVVCSSTFVDVVADASDFSVVDSLFILFVSDVVVAAVVEVAVVVPADGDDDCEIYC